MGCDAASVPVARQVFAVLLTPSGNTNFPTVLVLQIVDAVLRESDMQPRTLPWRAARSLIPLDGAAEAKYAQAPDTIWFSAHKTTALPLSSHEPNYTSRFGVGGTIQRACSQPAARRPQLCAWFQAKAARLRHAKERKVMRREFFDELRKHYG